MPLVLERSWVGRRVTVRRRVRDGDSSRSVDVVGDLVALDDEHAVVEGRSGPVEVALADVVAAKPAPPSTRDELDLQAVMARGWRAAETTELGAWLLRSNDGFTQRANSALPIGQPGTTIAEAIDAVQAWYAERGRPARFQLPVEGRRLLDAELGERGWQPSADVHVLTARLDLLDGTTDGPHVATAARPDDDWLGVFREGGTDTSASRPTLVRHDLVTFAVVRDGTRTVAIGRGTVDDGWLGVTAVEVVEQFRRQGLARAVMQALHAWGRDHGAARSYLAVTSENDAALQLYRSIGYRPHHDYRYRTEPAP